MKMSTPSLDPYIMKLEKFELFSTQTAYYLVGCDKHNSTYRVLKMDRTRIMMESVSSSSQNSDVDGATADSTSGDSDAVSGSAQEEAPARKRSGGGTGSSHNHDHHDDANRRQDINTGSGNPISGANSSTTPTNSSSNNSSTSAGGEHQQTNYRYLSEFCIEDSNIYTSAEIQQKLDMLHDESQSKYKGSGGKGSGGGLTPIAKAYGIVGFIRFLDCYYLTLITKRVKVGSIGGNGIYSIKNTETFPLKPAEGSWGSGGGNTPTHAPILSGGTGMSSGSFDNGDQSTNGAGGVGGGEASDPSSVLLNMWNRGKRSVGLGLTPREIAELRYFELYQVIDLTKNFFFSYTYDVTRSLQENFLTMTSQPYPPPPFKEMYAWNYFLTRELQQHDKSGTTAAQHLNSGAASSWYWVLPIIHGAFMQQKMNDYGRSIDLILMARRSRHFAGTRYLKRGVSDRGKVANDVEHEQIMHDESSSISAGKGGGGAFSSFLQMRGSIPTYWTQESSVTMPKPPIVLNRVDPTYHATQQHFEDLMKRYGSPIVVVDLVKQSEKREREVIVGNEFRHAIDYLNTDIDVDHKIRYCALDYSHISKHRNLNVSSSVSDVATWAVNQTGFFCSSPRWKIVEDGNVEPFDYETNSREAAFISHHLGVPVFPMEQKGILRTNCIDCLDRTNVAQFSAGVSALAQQLVVMGIRSSAKLNPLSNIVRVLIDMYVEIGDHISLQYGGSEAHKKGQQSSKTQSNIPNIGKHKEMLTSIRRYYSNTFTDHLKQDSMNLFLGYYVPSQHIVPLWELESDYYLHNFHVRAGGSTLQSMKAYQRNFAAFDWKEKDDENGKGTDLDISNIEDEPIELRIDRVKQRCAEQDKALSVWWRVAIQAYVQQRMWMQSSRRYLTVNAAASPPPELPKVPPRFERIYQPEKMAQFDKIFARAWATPLRLTHQAQHSQTDDVFNESSNHKNASGGASGSRSVSDASSVGGKNDDKSNNIEYSNAKMYNLNHKNRTKEQNGKNGNHKTNYYDHHESNNNDSEYQSIREYVSKNGYQSSSKPNLHHFLKAFEEGSSNKATSAAATTAVVTNIGAINTSNNNKRNDDLGNTNPTSSSSKKSSSNSSIHDNYAPNDNRFEDEQQQYLKQPQQQLQNQEAASLSNPAATAIPFGHENVGTLNYNSCPREEYVAYVKESLPFTRSSRHDLVKEEFKECMREYNIDSSDVQSIVGLVNSAHIRRDIQTGIYRGLSQNTSAVCVSTAIHEQFNTLAASSNDIPNEYSNNTYGGAGGNSRNFSAVDTEMLQKQQLDAPGVKCSIESGRDYHSRAKDMYKEILDSSSLRGTRSDLTNESSMKLYCSMFDDQTELSRVNQMYMLGQTSILPLADTSSSSSTSARTKNIGNVWNSDQKMNITSSSTAFISQSRRRVRPGFEQINEDLYARKENKYMVFNGPGVDSWRGSQPITKVKGIEEDFL